MSWELFYVSWRDWAPRREAHARNVKCPHIRGAHTSPSHPPANVDYLYPVAHGEHAGTDNEKYPTRAADRTPQCAARVMTACLRAKHLTGGRQREVRLESVTFDWSMVNRNVDGCTAGGGSTLRDRAGGVRGRAPLCHSGGSLCAFPGRGVGGVGVALNDIAPTVDPRWSAPPPSHATNTR